MNASLQITALNITFQPALRRCFNGSESEAWSGVRKVSRLINSGIANASCPRTQLKCTTTLAAGVAGGVVPEVGIVRTVTTAAGALDSLERYNTPVAEPAYTL